MRLKDVVSCFGCAVIDIERSLLYVARMEQKVELFVFRLHPV